MKKIILAIAMLPVVSFASIYSCTGNGFTVDIESNPFEMKIMGNGFNEKISNIKTNSTFDTIISGNTKNPPATIKLVIKDSSFANPGDVFKATLEVSSASGVKLYQNLSCTRGND